MPHFEAIRLENNVVFFASRRMVDEGIAAVEKEIREGLLHADVHPFTLSMNCQAWSLMQRPIAGEA